MCRKNRRCPGQAKHAQDSAWREARNERRRAAYAAKKTTPPAALINEEVSSSPDREIDHLVTVRPVDGDNEPMGEGGDGAYKMTHTAPDSEYGAQASDMTASGIFPEDFYDHPEYYATGFNEADKETFTALGKVRGNPDALVTVYRAAPPGSPINPGDWVTLSKSYARQHAMLDDNPERDMPVHAIQVRAADLFSAGDINEFGWDPGARVNADDVVMLGKAWPTEPPHPVTGWRMPSTRAQLPDGRRIRIEESGDGVGQYGYNGRFTMRDAETGEYMGHLDYQSSGANDDPALIAMVEVDEKFRGQRLADVLTARLAQDFPQGVRGGMLTDDGAKWWPGVAKRMGWQG